MAVGDYALPLIITDRPYFGPQQIRNQRQLTPDQVIRIHGPRGNIIEVTVTRVYKEDGDLKLDYKYYIGQDLQAETIFLKDYSVIRDEDGNWNNSNWLEKA